jgi:hypothetical protein
VTAQPPQLTATETRLIEQYVSVLDYLSRCAQAIDTDDWSYLRDKSAQLATRAERLAETASQLWQAIDQQGHLPRHGAIAAQVTVHGRHYRAGRLLHPADPKGRP